MKEWKPKTENCYYTHTYMDDDGIFQCTEEDRSLKCCRECPHIENSSTICSFCKYETFNSAICDNCNELLV